MAGTRARSTPKSSPRTATPARSRTKPSPLKSSVTPKARREPARKSSLRGPASSSSKKARTATSTSRKPARGKKQEGRDDDSGPELLSATGMTTSSSSSSASDDSGSDVFDPNSDDDVAAEEEVDAEDDDDEEMDSDNLDDESDSDGNDGQRRKGKRKSVNGNGGGGGSAKKVKKASSASKPAAGGKSRYDDEDDEEGEESEVELEEGQEIAGRIYPAPKTGQVPAGQISRNTMKWLANLQIPERNDRDWFRSHEPAFRQAEKEWQAFVGVVQMRFHEADDQVPILPPKDVIHRIYRDVRFSSDKTPYKRSFSMSTSRGGRKGIWAAYHLAISPNDKSIIAGGLWQPGKDELALIRQRILTNSQTMRDVLGASDFVNMFGEAKPHPKGKRQNVFGHDDALKIAPKIEGVDKGHKDIDLLKLRSIAVVKSFTDDEVLAEDFQDKIKDVITVMTPFVHMLNEYITLPDENGNENGDADDGDDADDDDDADEE